MTEGPIRREGKGDGFESYYYEFKPTGCEPVDNILKAVAGAGCSYHHTGDWADETESEAAPVRSIQTVANESAATWDTRHDNLAEKIAQVEKLLHRLNNCPVTRLDMPNEERIGGIIAAKECLKILRGEG